MAIALKYAARSDIGMGRYTNNQDSGYAGPNLLAVCDGMGGHAAGDVASSIVLAHLVALDGELHGGDAVELLDCTLREANAELRDRMDDDAELQGMGTTATALMLYGQRIALAHIGDSRAYLLRDDQLTQLTKDHTFVQSLVDEGRITAEQAEQHPQRNLIIRVLNGDAGDQADLSAREVLIDDQYLVCSDGLMKVVTDETVAETMRSLADPAECAEQLVQLALRGGVPDNITCVVARVVDPSRDPGSTVPEVVGSAAVHGTVAVPAPSSPAAKAAALGRPDEPDEADAPPAVRPPASGLRRAMRAGLTLLIVAALGAGGYAAYGWSQQQYYVGADGGWVAIYRGLPQDIGPVRMSHLFERQDIPLAQLPQYSADQVRSRIMVDDLAAARGKVTKLRGEVCPPQPPVVPKFGTPKPPAPTAPTKIPPTATTPTGSVPAGCVGAA